MIECEFDWGQLAILTPATQVIISTNKFHVEL